MEAAHEKGKAVHVWTVNSKTEIEQMKLLGVDNIITDYPVRAREILYREETTETLMEYLKMIASLGMASCMNQIAIAVVQISMNNILRHYGADSVYGTDIPIACVGIISKVNQVFLSICIGISQAVSYLGL